VSRASLVAVLVTAVGGGLAGCAQGSRIAATVSQPTDGAIVSSVRCVEDNHGVDVTGTVKRNTEQRQPNLLTYGGLRVSIYDSVGRTIGATHRLGTVTITTHGTAQSFQLTVSVRGTPAECRVDWGPPDSPYGTNALI
jgi:hypothetical protein